MMDEQAIRTVVRRLARRHASGGQVIERAAVMAEGSDSGAILAWIASHEGYPEPREVSGGSHGLHPTRRNESPATDAAPPRRYVIPPGAMGDPPEAA